MHKFCMISRTTVLDSDSFHVGLWVMIIVGLVGNVLVIVWRCTRPRAQRGSVLSVAIIILAMADLLYCVHLSMLEGLVARKVFGGDNLSTASSEMESICRTSGNMSLLSCSIAMWMTVNIAIYSCQALTGSDCCCSPVDRKRWLLVTVVCQLLFTTLPIAGIDIYMTEKFRNENGNNTVATVNPSQIFITCAYAQTAAILRYCNCSRNTCRLVHDACSSFDSKAAGIATNRTIFVSINCLLSLICAFVYIALCVRLTRQFHKPEDVHSGGGATELAKLKWRLALIVLINTACWMAVSIIHILRLLYTYDFMVSQDLISEDLIAVSVVLISTSPTINPLIYTIAGKQFLKFLKRCWKFLKCQISIRPSWETEHDYYLIGEKRCSCIPCIQCTVPRDLDRWNTEESSLFSSDEHSHDDSANLN
jgi:hypothetical protein